MKYYREIKNGEIFSYQQHMYPVESPSLEEICEEEYNNAILALLHSNEGGEQE